MNFFPTEWKLARVSPIFKKGKRDDPNNYRSISSIPTVAKIFGQIVYDLLCEYLNENNLLTHCQSGSQYSHCIDRSHKLLVGQHW